MRRTICGAGEAEHAADLDDLAVDREHRAHHAEIDREEHADRDQRDLRGFEDAEPQDEQRHPGDRRDRAQRLQGRIEQAARERRIAGDRAERACRPRRRSAKPAATRADRHGDVALQFAGRRKFDQRRPDARGRRHQPAVGEARAHRDFPERSPGPPAARGRARAAHSARASAVRVRRDGGFGDGSWRKETWGLASNCNARRACPRAQRSMK